MEYLRWVLLAIGVIVLVALYLIGRRHFRAEPMPLGEEPVHDPIDQHVHARQRNEADPLIEDISDWVEGVGEVRRVGAGGEPRIDEPLPPPRPAPRAPFKPSRPIVQMPEVQPEPALVDEQTRPSPVEPVPQTAVRKAVAPEPESGPDLGPDLGPESATPVVITLYLLANGIDGFSGRAIRDVGERLGFEFGEFDIYHYCDAHGRRLFSLMNAVAPGAFVMEGIDSLRTPALSLFMQLPVPGEAQLVLDTLLDVTHRLAENLDGQILDDRREPLSSESIDRWRERVADAQ
ncbi:MAG: cell division protein ZipA C-terminal FtsZ-binding domain-containing protein [Halothiobacillaceae bacterium]|nr:cell division protein ZipA C-terminal FtsZ-binding domain-containing protein [Halothiobacillaceae bacterium]